MATVHTINSNGMATVHTINSNAMATVHTINSNTMEFEFTHFQVIQVLSCYLTIQKFLVSTEFANYTVRNLLSSLLFVLSHKLLLSFNHPVRIAHSNTTRDLLKRHI